MQPPHKQTISFFHSLLLLSFFTLQSKISFISSHSSFISPHPSSLDREKGWRVQFDTRKLRSSCSDCTILTQIVPALTRFWPPSSTEYRPLHSLSPNAPPCSTASHFVIFGCDSAGSGCYWQQRSTLIKQLMPYCRSCLKVNTINLDLH